MNAKIVDTLRRAVLTGAGAAVLAGAGVEFYHIAWGTGQWYGQFSLKWGTAFTAFLMGSILLLFVYCYAVWRGPHIQPQNILHAGPAWIRWAIVIAGTALPALLLQYSAWGVVFEGPWIRLLIWAVCALVLAAAMGWRPGRASGTDSLLGALIVSGSGVLVAAALAGVTSYPFSLGWSEGNRLWDYSLLFGTHLYQFDPESPPVAYLDIGRQLIGGLPFLIPGVTIWSERLWLGALSVILPFLVGLLTFGPRVGGRLSNWALASLFGMAFLTQGPIHSPLLVCAVLVLLAWRLPLWWAVPLVAVSGYFAELSRFTWMFAPAMWAVMLELGGAEARAGRFQRETLQRVIVLGLAGLVAGLLAYLLPSAWSESSTGSSASVSTSQTLLWYRLLPNATYGDGILLGLARAAALFAAALVVGAKLYWRPTRVQSWVIILTLMAFLGVGLVVSTKIGGGGDLHNMDMFLIGLLMLSGLVWKRTGPLALSDLTRRSSWYGLALLLMVALPYYRPLRALRPVSFASSTEWLVVLTGVERAKDLGSLPSEEIVAHSLAKLDTAVDEYRPDGEVLLMDQRQLLTFGYLPAVPLVSEYEKKRMMDDALSANASQFASFYGDLARHRFSLIVSSPLRTPIKDSEYGFGEENNAWVKWVAGPVLCYYEEKDTLNEVKVELLTPRQTPVDCSAVLPVDLR